MDENCVLTRYEVIVMLDANIDADILFLLLSFLCDLDICF
jgi:hypothetical protein